MPSPAAPHPAEPSCAFATTGEAARVTVSGEIDLGTALLLASARRVRARGGRFRLDGVSETVARFPQ